MKLFGAALFILCFFVTDASAQRRPNRYPPSGDVRCEARDQGWEEHGGHRDCGSCLQQHERCNEVCSRVFVICDATGVTYTGLSLRFQGQGRDQWQASNEARRACEWNRDVRSCTVTYCRESNSRVSSRSCR